MKLVQVLQTAALVEQLSIASSQVAAQLQTEKVREVPHLQIHQSFLIPAEHFLPPNP
jgi:hypothetical protein